MTPRPSPALLQALSLFRDPRGARPGPEEPLPEGMELLIRVVAGDAQALTLAMKCTRQTGAAVRDAAVFYIQQVMFAASSDSYRVLGLDPDASDEQLKSHYRWLTRWLHPDRNPDEWEAVYSERVNRAWNDLRNAERRQRYDQGRPGVAASRIVPPPKGRPAMARPVLRDEVASPGLSLRWLPHAIFGGLGLIAVVAVVLFYMLRFANQTPHGNESLAASEPLPAVESSAMANLSRFQPGESAGAPVTHGSPPAAGPVEPQPRVGDSPIARADAQPPPPTPMAVREKPLPAVSPAGIVPTPMRNAPQAPLPAEPKLTASAVDVSNHGRQVAAEQAPAPPAVIEDRKPQQAEPAPVSQREANRVLGRFSEVYAQGDLPGMRAMFTPDASSPDGGLEDILAEYDRLFERSHQRVLAVRDVRWFANGDSFTIIAHYEATLKTGRFGHSRSLGDLRLDLRRENDQWLIYRLQHHDRSS